MGGIWLLWNSENVVVNVLAKETRAIHCNVVERSTSKNYKLTAVNAPAQINEKDDSWNHLNCLNNVIHSSWCILGDFNKMLHPSEKIGGARLCASRLQRLNNFLVHSKYHDAHVQGRIFTWKKLLRGNLIYEKLNRVIFREDCLQLFPNYLVTNGPFTCFDHSYVSLNTDPAHPPRKGTNFRY